jgi:hypothetical protein
VVWLDLGRFRVGFWVGLRAWDFPTERFPGPPLIAFNLNLWPAGLKFVQRAKRYHPKYYTALFATYNQKKEKRHTRTQQNAKTQTLLL